MEPTLFQNMLGTLKSYRGRYLKAFVMVLAANILLISNPLIFRKAVTLMEQSQESFFLWLLLLVSIAFSASFLKYQMRVTFIIISRDVESSVRMKLFEKMQDQSRAFYDKYGIGELLSRLTNDISAYRFVLGPGIMYPLFFLTLAVPGLAALFYISPSIAPFALIPLLLIPFINAVTRQYIYTYSKTVQEGLGVMSGMVQENYSGIRMVKSYAIEPLSIKRFKAFCYKLIKTQFKLLTVQGILYPLFSLMTRLVTVGLVWLFAWSVYRGYTELSKADFISFMWIQSYIFMPILMLAWLLPIYEKGRAAYDRLVEIYMQPVEVVDRLEATLSIPERATIEIKNLDFTYPLAKLATLKNLSVTIPGGSFLGVTGPIGSGKTTLIRLLNREYEIPEGKIFINGRDIHEYPLHSFSRAMVTVEQVPFLFSKSIADNIRFGRHEATQEELELVADNADLHATVLEFPERYETLVGERGVMLSGGQKQRVAMARAFLLERSIVILDDIFSAVDTATERRIFAKMRENFKGKTVILITHRVSILDQLERVLYLEDGHVVEEGSPADLKAKNGRYAALAQLQEMK